MAAAVPEQRKTVTVLFADVTGSTELGERLDPEAVRRVMERYFELAQRVVTRHGGTIEKFIGDAVMAVFGVPVLHEDDALRAVRAAADLRAQLPGLNAELKRDYEITLQVRTGVNTGEAVTAASEWMAAGDAVNIAARLEQQAAPGEILLGPTTVGLARDAIVVEALEPMALKGKARPVPVYRLVEVLAGAASPRRRLEEPMVGRAHQLRMLQDAFANVVRERTCALFTLLGVAGVGKSRLVAEFTGSIEATVVYGRCLSYGEGITYWPVVEVVRQLLANPGLDAEALMGGADQARAIRVLLGEAAPAGTSAEIAWAVRKLLERAAADRPLAVVLDDVHWGEQTFFDLVEQVADLSRGAPVLLLCMARPELLERRPAWGGGKLNATTVLLEPLNAEEANEMIGRLLPAEGLGDPVLRTRVLEAAAGNPLFLEEIAAIVASSGGDVLVPPTIQALLAARLDQLEPGERRILEWGSVEGNSFHRGAVEALGPEETSVLTKLVTLVRKDLVRPDEAVFPGDEAFRFRHLLIRDAAYDRLPKSVRARLHEKFANWLDERASDLTERDEIIGYHLERAYGYRRELGPVDAAAHALAAAAAGRLESAGRRALERGDASAAVNLLERASTLVSTGRVDISLELSVTWALIDVGRIAEAAVRAEAAADRVAEMGDRIGQLRAELTHLYILSHLDPEGRLAQLEDLVERARPVFELANDQAALGSLWNATWALEHYRCRFGAAADAATRAAEHATAADEQYLANWCRLNAAAGTAWGPMPVTDVLNWLDQQATLLEPSHFLEFWRAQLLPMIGRFDEARAAHRSDVERMTERGDRLGIALSSGYRIEMEAGRFAEAEAGIRNACRLLEEMGERSFWSTKACELAQTLYYLGRYDEAETWAQQGGDVGASDDACTQMLSRQVLAKVAARQEQFEKARTTAAEALEMADEMEAPYFQGEACLDVAEALWLAGDYAAATEQAERAASFFRQKGATVALERARRLAEAIASDRGDELFPGRGLHVLERLGKQALLRGRVDPGNPGITAEPGLLAAGEPPGGLDRLQAGLVQGQLAVQVTQQLLIAQGAARRPAFSQPEGDQALHLGLEARLPHPVDPGGDRLVQLRPRQAQADLDSRAGLGP
jgi:class 3 adenylate cyclase/tetratricopeptide (TPR) repeat protein